MLLCGPVPWGLLKCRPRTRELGERRRRQPEGPSVSDFMRNLLRRRNRRWPAQESHDFNQIMASISHELAFAKLMSWWHDVITRDTGRWCVPKPSPGSWPVVVARKPSRTESRTRNQI
ncbi:hypothetical protein AXG93_1200s1600 [Marchantia polymorpha subsp. ruderalis]|uniref:Uncharacterized protein n=1 Tax=Marchantia polymorpha subsp. ruderalis TaxID=1480154 RepID=A0A176WJG7_MARPO|nr:hypothetical protein AXG93_1200s1600 [Marchantia polymorpha subsp. ruderalis]